MGENNTSALHNTKMRLAACLKYCELRSKEEVTEEDLKYKVLWSIIEANKRD